MDQILEALRFGRERVSKGWSQEYWARNDAGEAVVPFDEDATRFCVCAAVLETHEGWNGAMSLLREVVGVENLTTWNDAPERAQADVVAAYDEAIRRRLAVPVAVQDDLDPRV